MFMAVSLAAVMCGCQTTTNNVINQSASDLILNSYSPRNFTSDPVPEADLEIVLRCGIEAPSARNMQPWKFIVAKEPSVMQQIIPDATQGNVLVIVCAPEENTSADFDCGLATENMVVAAQSLGLGARIYTNPVANINSNLKETLRIDAGRRAVAVLRIGNTDGNVDTQATASPRNSYPDVVTFL